MRTVKPRNQKLLSLGGALLLLVFVEAPANAQTNPEFEQLKSEFARQQKQILELEKALDFTAFK